MAVAWVCVVVPIGRLAHLWSIWCKRVADSEGRPRPEPFSPDELGTRGRRFGAFAVDTSLGCVAAVFVAIPFSLAGLSQDLASTLWWFVGVPLAFSAVTIPFMLREGKHAGQTLGKQLFGLRVVSDDHGRRQQGPHDHPRDAGQGAVLDRLDRAALPAGDRQRRVRGLRHRAP